MSEPTNAVLRDLIITSKDGDWGKEAPEDGTLRYHVIRGTDFEDVRLGDISRVPKRYLPEKTVLRRTLAPNDILIETAGGTRDRPTGRTMFVSERVLAKFDGPVTCASFARFLRIDPQKAHPEFVFWFLQHLYEAGEMGQHQVQHTGVARFQYTRFSETQTIPLPPLPEQKAIARILGTLDDKIELNRRMNATLEAMARALFQSRFVDFDPVHAKASGRQPSGIASSTAALFPSSFNSDDLPEGWRLGTVNELCEINSWTLGKKDELDELEYVEISEVNRGDIANISTYKRGEEPSRARRRLRHGDTAMSTVRPDRGSYFLALDPPEHRVASTGFAVVTPTKAPWSFVHIALTQPEVFERLGQLADGGAYPAVRPEVVGDLKLPIPNRPEVLAAFHKTCGPLFEQAEANRNQSRSLTTLRDTLLPKLLRGELSVANTQN